MGLTRAELRQVLLVLAVLADRARAAGCLRAQGDAPSLCSIFNVSASGPSWCEFLGTINGAPFFKYSCKSRMAEPVGPVGMMLNATKAWNQRCEHWTELFPELQNALRDNHKNIDEAFGTDSLSLQGSMMCEQESNGCHKTFWEFGFKGQMCLRFDSKNRFWAELHPGCSLLKETLGNNGDISRCLRWISNGDCVKLLNQSTVLNTKAAPAMAAASTSSPTVSATPTTNTTTVPAPSNAMNRQNNITWIIPLSFFSSILLFCIVLSIWKKRNAVQKFLRVWCSSTDVPSGRPPSHHSQGLTRDPQELRPLQQMGRPAEDPDATAAAEVTSSAL